MINSAMNYLVDKAQWAHQFVSENPVAGPVYKSFNENIGKPLWEQGVKVAAYAAPYFNPIKDAAVAKAKEYPIVAQVIGGAFLFFIARAVYVKYTTPRTL